MNKKKHWAMRYLCFCNDMETADKGDMNNMAFAEEQLIDEFYELNGNYQKGFNILMDYWDSLPEEERPEIDKALKEAGL